MSNALDDSQRYASPKSSPRSCNLSKQPIPLKRTKSDHSASSMESTHPDPVESWMLRTRNQLVNDLYKRKLLMSKRLHILSSLKEDEGDRRDVLLKKQKLDEIAYEDKTESLKLLLQSCGTMLDSISHGHATCCICLEAYGEGKLRASGMCGHVFCEVCIRSMDECGVCRRPYGAEERHRVYI